MAGWLCTMLRTLLVPMGCWKVSGWLAGWLLYLKMGGNGFGEMGFFCFGFGFGFAK